MELNHDTVILMVAIAAGSFVFTSVMLVVLANMGWISVAEGMPFVNTAENTNRVVKVFDFDGVYVTDVKMTPRGSFTLEVTNNMNSSVEVSELLLTNRYDSVACKCSASPDKIPAKEPTVITCAGCVNKEHQIGDEFKVQVDMRQYYPETGILRNDAGVIMGFYRV